MKTSIFFIYLFLILSLFSQDDNLQSGPMVGYSEMKEVMLWVQTKTPAKVYIRYWVNGDKSEIFNTKSSYLETDSACIVHLIAVKVLPSKKYSYELIIDDKLIVRNYPFEFQLQVLWQNRSGPPNFSIAVGSFAYINDSLYDRPGKPYGGKYEIYSSS